MTPRCDGSSIFLKASGANGLPLSPRHWHLSWTLQRPSEHCKSTKSGWNKPFQRREKGAAPGTGRGQKLLEAESRWGREEVSHRRRLGSRSCGCSRSPAPGGRDQGFPEASPNLRPAPPPLQPPQQAGDTPLGAARPGVETPRGPSTSPAGCPHLAQQPSQTLAVELHLQASSRVRSATPAPRPPFAPAPGRRPPRTKLPGRRKAPPLPGSKVNPPPTPHTPRRFRGK